MPAARFYPPEGCRPKEMIPGRGISRPSILRPAVCNPARHLRNPDPLPQHPGLRGAAPPAWSAADAAWGVRRDLAMSCTEPEESSGTTGPASASKHYTNFLVDGWG